MSLSKRLINTGGGGAAEPTTFDFIFASSDNYTRTINVSNVNSISAVSSIYTGQNTYTNGMAPAYITLPSDWTYPNRVIYNYTNTYQIYRVDPNTGIIVLIASRTQTGTPRSLKFDNTNQILINGSGKIQGFANGNVGVVELYSNLHGDFTITGSDISAGNGVIDEINGLYFVQDYNDPLSIFSTANAQTSMGDKINPTNFKPQSLPLKVDVDPYNKVGYISSYTNPYLSSFDYSDPTNPTLLQNFNTGAGQSQPRVLKLDLVNQVAYQIHNYKEIVATDISDPSNMTALGTFSDGTNMTGATDIVIDNVKNIAYVSCATSSKLCALDISDPTNITLITAFSTGALRGLSYIPKV